MKQVAISLESEVAKAYLNARPEIRKKAEITFNFWLKDILMDKKKAKKEFFSTIQRLSKIARANGLTPEILNEILNEKRK